MFGAEDVVEVVARLELAGVGLWLDGGWGVDALLGTQTRPHSDLDLVVAGGDAGAAVAALAGLGFRPDPEAAPGLPARLVLVDGRGRQVDLHPVSFDEAGNGWQDLGGGAWGDYPAAGLAGTGLVAGRRVRCVAAALQVAHHMGYPLTADDRHDLRLLAERFGVAVPPEV
jgi:lincosamide nucleotidyltransferase A/C/D/E